MMAVDDVSRLMPTGLPSIRHVIFDLDGTLLDTESILTQTTREIVAQFGKEYTWSTKLKMMGRSSREAAAILIEELSLPLSVDEYLSQRQLKLRERMPHCKLMEGAEQLIRHLRAHGVPLALATSSSRAEVELKTKNYRDLFSLFNVNISRDELEESGGKSKPAPDIYLLAARQLGVEKVCDALVVEDALSGVQSALDAGMHVLWVPPDAPGIEVEEDKFRAKIKYRSKDSVNLQTARPQLFVKETSLLKVQLERLGLPPFTQP